MLRRIVLFVSVAAIAAALVAPVGNVAAAPGKSPKNEVLIVTANLAEAYPNGNDLNDKSDMKLFVRTLVSNVKYAPDVLLLQEVNRGSATFVAKYLSRKVVGKYVAAVKPGQVTVQEKGRTVHTETAILLNTGTMTKKNKGGYIRLSYDRQDAVPGRLINVRRQAHLLAKENSSGELIALMSVRFENRIEIKDSEDWSYRTKWTKRVASYVKDKYRRTANGMRAIGGDFNAPRCTNGNTPCNEARWYKVIKNRFDYVDAFQRPGLWTGVDMIFAQKSSPDAGMDNSSRPYSDHRFRWAVVSP